METNNLHKGHRQRLKEKVKNNGLKSLSTHEVLELLLTYSIPYKDTNALAHTLLNSFGNLYNVLHASREELMTITGIGEESALFLTILPDFFDIYKSSKNSEVVKLLTVKDCVDYFLKNIEIDEIERSYIAFTDKDFKLLRLLEISQGGSLSTSIDRDKLSKCIALTNAKNIVLFHTHPNGRCLPSDEDVLATKAIIGMTRLLGVHLVDHIIINNCEHYSFRNNNRLLELQLEIERKLNDIMPGDKK